MNQIPSQDPLTEALRALPRETASAGFAARVLSRIEESPPEAHRIAMPFRPLIGLGAAILLLVVGITISTTLGKAGHRSAQADLLRARHRALSEELSRIQSTASSSVPVMYVGGSDDADFYLDARPLLVGQPGVDFSQTSYAEEIY